MGSDRPTGFRVPARRRGAPPPNPEDARLGFRGWHERGYLPHRDEPGLVQFVTLRLADSFPAGLRSEWAALLELEDDRARRLKLEDYLDQGRGECALRSPEIAQIVEQAVRFYHQRYFDLRAWVVMPNHVHVLFQVGATPLARVMDQLKTYTAREANKRLGRRGPFWAEDYWDTFLRDADHEMGTRHYIENNPVKAHLVLDSKQWPWSSARCRDEYGALRL